MNQYAQLLAIQQYMNFAKEKQQQSPVILDLSRRTDPPQNYKMPVRRNNSIAHAAPYPNLNSLQNNKQSTSPPLVQGSMTAHPNQVLQSLAMMQNLQMPMPKESPEPAEANDSISEISDNADLIAAMYKMHVPHLDSFDEYRRQRLAQSARMSYTEQTGGNRSQNKNLNAQKPAEDKDGSSSEDEHNPGVTRNGIVKDSAYYERRRKNNDAAKKSRDRRRMKQDEIAIRVSYLERLNYELTCQMMKLQGQLAAKQK